VVLIILGLPSKSFVSDKRVRDVYKREGSAPGSWLHYSSSGNPQSHSQGLIAGEE